MSPVLYAAAGLGLAAAFLLWRLMAAQRKIGKLKVEVKALKKEQEAEHAADAIVGDPDALEQLRGKHHRPG